MPNEFMVDRRSWWLQGCLLALAVAASSLGCSSVDGAPTTPSGMPSARSTAAEARTGASTFTLKGAFDLFVTPGSVDLEDGAACRGTDSYDDVKEFTPVKVFDGQGKLLATGRLAEGKFVSNPIGTACTFGLTVPDVPDGLLQYAIEIGSHGARAITSETAHTWVFLKVEP